MSSRFFVVHPDLDGDQWLSATIRDPGESKRFVDRDKNGELLAYSFSEADWIPPFVQFHRYGKNARTQQLASFTSLAIDRFLVSATTRTVIDPLLNDVVDWMPFNSDRGLFFWMRVHRTIDALDKTRSIWTGRSYAPAVVFEIEKYVLYEDKIVDAPLFRMPDGIDLIYATSGFVDLYENALLTGLRFEAI